ncbi:MAG TPA: hypothetical protein VIJ78_13370 [Pseudolabrys sp.]|nr:hypothetical protein [Pseudolabrys sp.]
MMKEADELALLAELNRERDRLDETIEGLIADMADAAPEERKGGDWAPEGALTRKYLELTNRQAELEREIIDLSRAITAAAKPTLPN